MALLGPWQKPVTAPRPQDTYHFRMFSKKWKVKSSRSRVNNIALTYKLLLATTRKSGTSTLNRNYSITAFQKTCCCCDIPRGVNEKQEGVTMRSSAYQPLPLQAYQSHLMKLHFTSPLLWVGQVHTCLTQRLWLNRWRDADQQKDEDNQKWSGVYARLWRW